MSNSLSSLALRVISLFRYLVFTIFNPNYDLYKHFELLSKSKSDNLGVMVIFKGKQQPIIVKEVLDVNYYTTTIKTNAIIENVNYNLVAIVNFSDIRSVGVFDKNEHNYNNFNNIMYLENLYRK